jgi:hypothetical protein
MKDEGKLYRRNVIALKSKYLLLPFKKDFRIPKG